MSDFFPAAPRLCPRRGVALGVCCGLVAIVSGCAPAPAPPLVTRADLEASAKVSPGAKRQTESSGSLNAALSKIDAGTVQAWFNRLSAPLSASNAAAPSEVRIDAEVLARRHPAWQLADALERGTVS
ncbi:MAG TPA: hypothetical protein VF627_11135, partial [Abditibacterium sp.]